MAQRTRRGFLSGTVGATAALGGCLGGSSESRNATETTTLELMTSGSSDVSFSHPAASGINDQPTLGDRGRDGVIVAFEDPSCPTCRRFHEQTFPAIKSDLVATGDVAYVVRGYPIIYPWGQPASKALEATFARDAAAVWDLADFYFDNQRGLDADSVRSRTRQFLTDATGVDGDAVVTALDEQATTSAVQTDLDAGEAADVSGTPTFFLFRDGEFQTTVSGAQDFTVFERVLRG